MLKSLRKKGVAKKIFIFLAIVIIPAFMLWGSASLMRSQKDSYAGKLFGRKVSFDEYQESLHAVRTQAFMQFGENFYKIQKFLNLEKEAWDRLILLHEANKRKIRVTDQEVVEEINGLPFFQNDGKFDRKTYETVLEYVLKTPARFFEEQTRQQLMLAKMYRQLTDKITASDEEIKAEYQKENEKVKVSYLLFSPANFEKDITLSKDEAENYFNGHRQEFKQPPSISIQYLGLEYPKEAGEEAKQALQEKVKSISSLLQKGEPLEKVVKLNNIELEETGFFSTDEGLPKGVPFEIIQTALTLKGKEFSNPVLASTGCFLARIKETRDAYLPDFPEAKPKVEKLLIQQKSRKLTEEKAKKLRERINLKTKDLNGWASEAGLKVSETTLFRLGDYLPNIGPSAEFHNTAFSLKDKNTVSEVIAGPQGFYILRLDEFVPIDEQKFQQEKEEFRIKLLDQKKREFFNTLFEEVKNKANLQDNVSKLKVGWY